MSRDEDSPVGLHDEVVLLECNLDDMTGEALGFVMEKLMESGALDVWFTPIYMKKNRPGTMLSALCRSDDAPKLRACLLRETTTLGVRYRLLDREIAERRSDEVRTPWGKVRRKLKILDGCVVSIKPEYEDCACLAREHNISLEQVARAAREAHPEP